jgi:hypothetical protein
MEPIYQKKALRKKKLSEMKNWRWKYQSNSHLKNSLEEAQKMRKIK